jgi:formylglycine-generating enzyme required for sulfatase activity
MDAILFDPDTSTRRMGSAPNDPDRLDSETAHSRAIPHGFAIAAKEVTVEEYQSFMRENPPTHGLPMDSYSPIPEGPMNGPG